MTTSAQVVPVSRPALTGRTVADVMVTAPTTIQPSATVADARRFFEDNHVHMAFDHDIGRAAGHARPR
jgi:CBS domain-containing protein